MLVFPFRHFIRFRDFLLMLNNLSNNCSVLVFSLLLSYKVFYQVIYLVFFFFLLFHSKIFYLIKIITFIYLTELLFKREESYNAKVILASDNLIHNLLWPIYFVISILSTNSIKLFLSTFLDCLIITTFMWQLHYSIYIHKMLLCNCIEKKVAIKPGNQTNKVCKLNYSQNLAGIYFISIIII